MEYIERKRILFLGLPWTFTRYKITSDIINIQSGLLKTTEHDCYMYKVVDVQLETSLFEKIFKMGTVICYTGDATHAQLRLVHIKRAKEIKNFILEASEQERVKRRTLHTLDIGENTAEEIND